LEEYLLHGFPNEDFVIYEVGAGNGTLMCNFLDFIKQEHPEVYERTKYNVIEVSASLAEKQDETVARHDADHVKRVTIHQRCITEWSDLVTENCFFLAMEVIVTFFTSTLVETHCSNHF
jgi:SAM-dependent MidA family methyltransferase